MDATQELNSEDAKLVTLARSSRARSGAVQGAAVRDSDGRTYAACSIDIPSLQLTALQLAVAMAVSSGVPGLEAAVIVADRADHKRDDPGIAAVRDLAAEALILLAEPDGTVVGKA